MSESLWQGQVFENVQSVDSIDIWKFVNSVKDQLKLFDSSIQSTRRQWVESSMEYHAGYVALR
jgi:hypothetical protein